MNLRIAAASRCAWSLNKTIKSRQISKVTKTLIYKTVIRPVLTYGCETWRLTKALERRLGVFERGVLRRIWGPVIDAETGEWRRLHNHELMELARIPAVTNIICSHRLRWAGHVARMDEVRPPRQVLDGVPAGRRPLGRPRKRWEDNVKEDLEAVGVRRQRWKEQAQDRLRWRELVRAAKELPGPAPPE